MGSWSPTFSPPHPHGTSTAFASWSPPAYSRTMSPSPRPYGRQTYGVGAYPVSSRASTSRYPLVPAGAGSWTRDRDFSMGAGGWARDRDFSVRNASFSPERLPGLGRSPWRSRSFSPQPSTPSFGHYRSMYSRYDLL